MDVSKQQEENLRRNNLLMKQNAEGMQVTLDRGMAKVAFAFQERMELERYRAAETANKREVSSLFKSLLKNLSRKPQPICVTTCKLFSYSK